MKIILPFLLSLIITAPALAEEPLKYDRINFSVNAEKEVENDVLTANLYADKEGNDTAIISAEVNEMIDWAMKIAKEDNDEIESRTTSYTTNPVYNDGQVKAWRVRQNIRLKSKNSKKLSALLGKLQEKLKIQSIQYSVSTELRKTIEDELIIKATENFKSRADLVAKQMGRSNYKVVRLHIADSYSQGPAPFMENASYGVMAKAARSSAPVLESGKQKISVSIQAEIELAIN